MSTTIPLTFRVDHKIGLDAKDLTPVQIEELSAQQAIFSCGCLFYLLRQAAKSEPHDPLFNPLMFLHALEQIAELGEALSNAAYDHVESLAASGGTIHQRSYNITSQPRPVKECERAREATQPF